MSASIFGAAPYPGSPSTYTDGAPGITLAQEFETFGGFLPDALCVGGRVYVPLVEPIHMATVTIMAWVGGSLADAPLRTKTVPVSGTGWVEAVWDEPFDMPADGQRVRIGYRFSGSEVGAYRYVHSGALRADGSPIQSAELQGLQLSAAPSGFQRIDGNSEASTAAVGGYGIDILVEGTPIDPEVEPVAEAGNSRTVFVGQPVTLSGAASSDADGTVESYSWWQISGPTAALSGSGPDRSFTPTTPGTYVFGLQVTDNDNLESPPDTVTITVNPVPVVPVTTGGTARPVAKMGSVERALLALFVRDLEVLEESDARIGGEFPRTVDDFYIRIDRVPGGRTTTFEGDYVLDVEVFSYDYLRAEDIAEDIEALMLADGYHTIVTGGKRWTLDGVYQNIGIADLPWEADEDMNRLMATYAVTVRRGAV